MRPPKILFRGLSYAGNLKIRSSLCLKQYVGRDGKEIVRSSSSSPNLPEQNSSEQDVNGTSSDLPSICMQPADMRGAHLISDHSYRKEGFSQHSTQKCRTLGNHALWSVQRSSDLQKRNFMLSSITNYSWCSGKGSDLSQVNNRKLLDTSVRKTFPPHRDFSLTPQGIVNASPKQMQPYLRLIRFDKPIGTYLLYWPCTWSIAMATAPGYLPDLWLLALFGAGSFFMRGAGCIINDMWDRDIDKKVERTKLRPLTSGELTMFQGLTCLGGMLSLSLGILCQLNNYSIILGASSMILVILYPLAKRFTYWPQAMLGVTLNWGVLISWSAINGGLDWSVAPLYLACVLYTLIYDSIYSHQDKYDDMLIGVKSTALKFGDQTKYWLSGFGAVMISGLTISGAMCDQTWPYYTAVALTAGHLFHQIWSVDLDNADDCAAKFRSNTRLGFLLFLGVTMGTLMKMDKQNDGKEDEKETQSL